MDVADLFAGGGGTGKGILDSGMRIVFAANHCQTACDYYEENHIIKPVCANLTEMDWSIVPEHDVLGGSPCCHGHTPAAGIALLSKKADVSRSTAYAIVSFLDFHQSKFAVIENVPQFRNWKLYPAWKYSLECLGYQVSPHIVNCADLGVPQSRTRLFIILTLSENPIKLDLPRHEHIPARSIIDTRFDGHRWDLVSNRVKATQRRVKQGRIDHGEMFIDSAYGSGTTGHSLDKLLGTVMTINKHSLVKGKYIRALTVAEQSAAQSFPVDYKWPSAKTKAKQLIGNAVPPVAAKEIYLALQRAA